MILYRRLACALLLSFSTLCFHSAYADDQDHRVRTADIERVETSVAALIEALDRIGAETGKEKEARKASQSAEKLRRQALDQQNSGDSTRAMALMQEALVTVKIKIAELKQGTSTNGNGNANGDYRSEKRLGEIEHLNSSLDALTDALIRIGEEKARTEFAGEIAAQARQQQLASRALAERGALVEARNELDQALVTVKTAIATLRHRDTLVRSLNFASKEEEYRYELDRHDTYAMLIDLLVEKRSADDITVKQMERFRQQAEEQQKEAEAAAAEGDFARAVELQEKSNHLLLQAIRRGGIYVPG